MVFQGIYRLVVLNRVYSLWCFYHDWIIADTVDDLCHWMELSVTLSDIKVFFLQWRHWIFQYSRAAFKLVTQESPPIVCYLFNAERTRGQWAT